ncbi:DUF948 domain-containing protein [Bacillus sp. 2205SS5-2]|uniref:DUF948 domain-containing protein n=1 Tax=Bacillus sp. 2205SS5-2 TaxID=3109031 RepID=UPI003003D86F
MIIIYMSLTVIILTLIYLGFHVFRTYQNTQHIIQEVNKTILNIQNDVEGIKQESNALSHKQHTLEIDFKQKTNAIKQTVDFAKQTPRLIHQVWKAGNGK